MMNKFYKRVTEIEENALAFIDDSFQVRKKPTVGNPVYSNVIVIMGMIRNKAGSTNIKYANEVYYVKSYYPFP